MKVKIINEVKTIRFGTTFESGSWFIKINSTTIKRWSSIGYYGQWVMRTWDTLADAIKYAKRKGYIPKDFDLKELQTELEVEVSC